MALSETPPNPYAARLRVRRCRFWDFAASESKTADYTVGARLALVEDTRQYYVEDVVRGRWGPKDADDVLLQTTRSDGIDCEVCIEEEGGSAGKKVTAAIMLLLSGYAVHAERSTGSKWARAKAFAAQCEAGNVRLVRGAWNAAFLDELTAFDHAEHDDQVDASAGAFNRLALGAQAGFWGPNPHDGQDEDAFSRPRVRRGIAGLTWR